MNIVTAIASPRVDAALLPCQRKALEELEAALADSQVVALVGRTGLGKSEIARVLAKHHGADYLDAESFIGLAAQEPAIRWDEHVFRMIYDRLERTNCLILDDYSFLRLLNAQAGQSAYSGISLHQLLRAVRSLDKRLLLVGRTQLPTYEHQNIEYEAESIASFYDDEYMPIVTVGPDLEAEDFAELLAHEFGSHRAADIDSEVVHLYAPNLTIRQLKFAASLARDVQTLTTAAFIEILGEHILHDNMRLEEVEQLDFASLPGSDEIAQALETHVVVPFERPDVARRLGIKAKRGVMLFGPPGTGKTSIGRALAQRMKGRFFLIDGTLGTEPPHFFMARVKAIINQAIRHAPCVLFIDDADILFTIPHVAGIVRYLLTILDGLESEAASRVCVMMTVMDASKVPDALVRSGRVELWLETKLPDEPTRARMIERWASADLFGGEVIDFAALARLAKGFTPADLRRVVDDSRLFHARDVKAGAPSETATSYIAQAIKQLKATRNRMADVLEDDRLRLEQMEEESLA
jgi:ATP-dependent 26S proteasome regulatory subunit